MNLQEKEDKINAFWNWFIENKNLIIQVYEDGEHSKREMIVISLDNFILDFGKFSWTIGEGKNKPYYLTISPNGDKELLQLSKNVMYHAPELSNWEFNYANPINDKNLIINLFDDYMMEQVVDAASWNFVLEKNKDNSIIIIIEAENIPISDSESRLSAGLLVVSKLIGEEMMINKVAKVEVLSKFELKHKSKSNSIINLKERFEELLLNSI